MHRRDDTAGWKVVGKARSGGRVWQPQTSGEVPRQRDGEWPGNPVSPGHGHPAEPAADQWSASRYDQPTGVYPVAGDQEYATGDFATEAYPATGFDSSYDPIANPGYDPEARPEPYDQPDPPRRTHRYAEPRGPAQSELGQGWKTTTGAAVGRAQTETNGWATTGTGGRTDTGSWATTGSRADPNGRRSAGTGEWPVDAARATGGRAASRAARSRSRARLSAAAAESETAGQWQPVLAWTVGFFVVPIVLYLLWAWTRSGAVEAGCVDVAGAPCLSPRIEALSSFADAFPSILGAMALSLLAAVGLRLLNDSWRAPTVGLGGAVIGAGIATFLASAAA